jgi:hypothetical protein
MVGEKMGQNQMRNDFWTGISSQTGEKHLKVAIKQQVIRQLFVRPLFSLRSRKRAGF